MDDPAHAPTAQGAAALGGELAHTATQAGGAARELSAQAGLARGELLAHYRVERMLGAGGMGQVYLAEDLGLMRQVAVKVLAPHLLERGPVHMERMMREARTQASVNHPNLCHVYYVGQQAAQVFVAMEYVRGRTFAQLGRLTPPVALRLVRQAAQGLAAMAEAGVVHRDIKPSNLMLDDTGLVKVLDFGLGATCETEAEADVGLSATQSSFGGTPLYMAPEQARGERVDLRTDMYALGATLYFLLTGAPPFAATSLPELQLQHAESKRPIVTGPKRQLEGVNELIARMMAADPGQRFASYAELLAAIEMLLLNEVRPAGLVVRSMAWIVDMVVMFVPAVALAKFFVVVVSADLFTAAIVPAIALVVVLLGYVSAQRRGSVGQRLLQLELRTFAGAYAPARAHWFRLGLLWGGVVVAEVLEEFGMWSQADDVVWLGLAASGLLALRTPERLTWWDRLTRTRLVYQREAVDVVPPRASV